MSIAASGVRGARVVCAAAVLGLTGASLFGLGGCASMAAAVHEPVAAPLADWEELPNASLSGDRTFGGQPSAAALDRYAAQGGAMVIDLRTHEGRDAADFDEAATVKSLGMKYVNIPFSSSTFSAADVDRFAAALDDADGPVLVHCGSSNRVGGMWAAYLARKRGFDAENAIAAGKAAGMSSESVEAAARRVIDE